jgi:hypothetical protein
VGGGKRLEMTKLKRETCRPVGSINRKACWPFVYPHFPSLRAAASRAAI